jgi:hypothetical protein
LAARRWAETADEPRVEQLEDIALGLQSGLRDLIEQSRHNLVALPKSPQRSRFPSGADGS